MSLSFSDALIALKEGKKVARDGWNGKAMWLTLIIPGRDGLDEIYGDGNITLPFIPCIGMKTADNNMCPGWLASQTDMLADDWCIIEE